MITESEIYWITRMDYIHEFLVSFGGVLALLMFFGVAASVIFYIYNTCAILEGEGNKALLPMSKKYMLWSLAGLFLALPILVTGGLVPTTKEMCAIKVIPAIANNEDVQEIPSQLAELTKEWIEELKPKKDE